MSPFERCDWMEHAGLEPATPCLQKQVLSQLS